MFDFAWFVEVMDLMSEVDIKAQKKVFYKTKL
jgi:hypothetical protein